MADRTYDWNGHTNLPISYPDLSDFHMAGKVRMLMRSDLDHEGVVCGARDRIMSLSKEKADLTTEIERLRSGIKRLSDEEELCAEATGNDPFSMVYLAAKLAKAEAEIKALQIDASNHAADAETVRRERDDLIRANGFEKIGYVTAGELAHLRLGVSCIDLFGEVVPDGVEMVPVFAPAAPAAKGGDT